MNLIVRISAQLAKAMPSLFGHLNPELHSEQRVDKHGHRTTKWVRNQPKEAASKKPKKPAPDAADFGPLFGAAPKAPAQTARPVKPPMPNLFGLPDVPVRPGKKGSAPAATATPKPTPPAPAPAPAPAPSMTAPTPPTLKEAYDAGVAAFHAGAKAIPNSDTAFMERLKDLPVGGSSDLLRAWANGWHTTNVQSATDATVTPPPAPVPGVDPPRLGAETHAAGKPVDPYGDLKTALHREPTPAEVQGYREGYRASHHAKLLEKESAQASLLSATPGKVADQQIQRNGEGKVAKLLNQLGIAQDVFTDPHYHATVSAPGFMDLHVERIDHGSGTPRVSLAHYASQGGDTMLETEAVYDLHGNGQLKLAETAVNGGFGEHRGLDRPFGQLFARNLTDQGFGKGTVTRSTDDEPTPETPETAPDAATPAAPHVTYSMTRKEYAAIHTDYKGKFPDGTPNVLRNEKGATVLVPVNLIPEDGSKPLDRFENDDILNGKLHEGDTKQIDGTSYRLNRNHRWERVDGAQAVATPARAEGHPDTAAQQHAQEAAEARIDAGVAQTAASLAPTPEAAQAHQAQADALHAHAAQHDAGAAQARSDGAALEAYVERLASPKKKAYAQAVIVELAGGPKADPQGLDDADAQKVRDRVLKYHGSPSPKTEKPAAPGLLDFKAMAAETRKKLEAQKAEATTPAPAPTAAPASPPPRSARRACRTP